MVSSLILVEGKNLSEQELKQLSLRSSKQLIIGSHRDFGVILHIASNSLSELKKSVQEFKKVSGVINVKTIRTKE